MNIYFISRWGHPESPDGPDGEDTNFLVHARSVEEAAAITDAHLADAPTTSLNSSRPVQPFCHHITQLGVCSNNQAKPGILHGPWIAYALLQNDGPAWGRHDLNETWTSSDMRTAQETT